MNKPKPRTRLQMNKERVAAVLGCHADEAIITYPVATYSVGQAHPKDRRRGHPGMIPPTGTGATLKEAIADLRRKIGGGSRA
jgi:hypothetical protein